MIIRIAPIHLGWVALWLRTHRASAPEGLLGQILADQLRDDHDIDGLATQFEKVARRRRVKPSLIEVDLCLSKADAEWLAVKGARRRGMFGGGGPKPPPEIELIGRLCAQALRKRRGRPLLTGERLKRASSIPALDPRHRQRLRARLRKEQAERESWSTYGGALAKALADALAKSD